MTVESIREKFAEAGRFAEAWHCNMYLDTLSRLYQLSILSIILIGYELKSQSICLGTFYSLADLLIKCIY